MGLFSKPSPTYITPPPPPPPSPATMASSSVQDSQAAARAAAAAASGGLGYAGTVKTSSEGASQTPTAQKALLGS
jgi:hypothetical protein